MSASPEYKDEKHFDDKEAGPTVNVYDATPEDIKIDVHTNVRDGVTRGLKQRHVQMIALAGTLGTGLFLGSGKAIARAGPAGALLAYILVGTIVWSMIQSLGEMMCFAPISGGYVHMAERYVHPSAGFMLGWMQWYSSVIALPTEIISAAVIIGFWDDPMSTAHLAGYCTLLLFLCGGINFFGVRWFGESEFFFAIIKILLILGLILGGLIVDLGGNPRGERIGFRYWKNPGAFAPLYTTGTTGNFLGWFTVLLQAGYSFSGMEALAMTVGELQNPRAAMAKAVRRIFWRILFFYIAGMIIIGMLVPYNDPNVLQATGSTAASSPFVIAFNRFQIKGLPSVINAGVLTSAFSAGNSGVYGSSRLMYGLALRGQAPKIFATTITNKKSFVYGLPYVSLSLSCVFIFLSYMSLSEGAQTVLNWLSNLTSIASFIGWFIISLTFTRWKAAVDAQGWVRKESKFLYNRFQPYPAYWAMFWCAVIVLFNGFSVFIKGNWDTSSFVISYINLPICALLFFGHYFWTGRPAFRRPHDVDLVSNIPGTEIDIEVDPATTKVGKFFQWLF